MREAIAEDEDVRLQMRPQGPDVSEEGIHRGIDVPQAFNIGAGVFASPAVAVEEPEGAILRRKSVRGASCGKDRDCKVSTGGVKEPPEDLVCIDGEEADNRCEGAVEETVLFDKRVGIGWNLRKLAAGSVAEGAEDGGHGSRVRSVCH